MTEETNLYLWNRVEATNPKFASDVDSPGFKYTSVNAQYLIRTATEIWGPCGTGWGYSSVKSEVIGTDDKRSWLEKVRLWYTGEDGERHEVEHYGVSLYIYKTRGSDGYMRVDEQAPKKALTNGLSKCLSVLGFSADLWLKYYNSAAYRKQVAEEFERREADKTDERILARLNSVLEQSGAETDADKDSLCRFWSNGEYGYGDVEEDIEAAKACVGGQANLCSGRGGREKVLAVKHLEEARKWGQA